MIWIPIVLTIYTGILSFSNVSLKVMNLHKYKTHDECVNASIKMIKQNQLFFCIEGKDIK